MEKYSFFNWGDSWGDSWGDKTIFIVILSK